MADNRGQRGMRAADGVQRMLRGVRQVLPKRNAGVVVAGHRCAMGKFAVLAIKKKNERGSAISGSLFTRQTLESRAALPVTGATRTTWREFAGAEHGEEAESSNAIFR